jgi:hypothetical protein
MEKSSKGKIPFKKGYYEGDIVDDQPNGIGIYYDRY